MEKIPKYLKKEDRKYATTSHNRLVYASPPLRSARATRDASRAWAKALERPLWRFAPPQFASPAKPDGFTYSGWRAVVYNQTLYDILP